MTRTSQPEFSRTDKSPTSLARFRGPERSPRVMVAANKPAAQPGELCAIAAKLAASHYEVTLADIGARTRRSHRATRARHVAMYLAHIAFGLNLAAIAVAFGRSRRMAARACALVEDARDDAAFDAALAGLEISARILLEYERAEKAA
jgi:hypothetical protein